MIEKNLTKSKVGIITDISREVVPKVIDLGVISIEESGKTEREFFKCQQAIATDSNLPPEKKKYYFDENNKIYRDKEEHKTCRLKIFATFITFIISVVLFIPRKIFKDRN